MAKTPQTAELERNIYLATKKQGVFGCFEVTIGWFGNERVDYLTFDTKGIWRCYEVKVSVADFRSKAKKTFCGHFNYYVLTQELYDKVKEEIPPHIGVYVHGFCAKRAKKQELIVDEQVLKDSFIRSLSREVDKGIKSNNPDVINNMNRRIKRAEDERDSSKRQYRELMETGNQKFGRRWHIEKV